jgi:hypothetical protein
MSSIQFTVDSLPGFFDDQLRLSPLINAVLILVNVPYCMKQEI